MAFDNGYLTGAAKDFWHAIAGQNQYRAPAVTYDYTNSNQARAAGQTAADQMGQSGTFYQGLMTGRQPSLAQRQMQQGISQAQATGMQQAGAARGMDRAAAFRQAQNNAASGAAQGAVAGGNLRLQEQQLGAQGNVATQQGIGALQQAARQADIGEQLGIIGQQTQREAINAGVTNANAANEQKGAGGMLEMGGAALAALSDIRAKEDITPAGSRATQYAGPDTGAMSKAMAAAGADTSAATNPFAQALMNYGQSQQQGSGGGSMFNAQDTANMTAGLQSVLSDENSKEALRGVEPYEFRYKDAFAHDMASKAANEAYARTFADAKTPRAGVMAQDLAATPEGSRTVVDTPEGMAINGKRAMAFMLANQADFNDRLQALEGRRKGKVA